MNDQLRKYLTEKYKLNSVDSIDEKDNELAAAYKAADERKNSFGMKASELISGLGGAISGRGTQPTQQAFNQKREDIDSETVGQAIKSQAFNSNQQKIDKDSRINDANSNESQSFRKVIEANFPQIAKAYGDGWVNVTAADQDSIFKPLQLKEQIEARKEAARISAQAQAENRADRQFARDAVTSQKETEKLDKKKAAMFEVEDRRKNIQDSVTQLKAMIKDKGTYEAFGSHNQDMDRLAEQIATDMAKLMDPSSVARPAEVEAVKKSLVKPGFTNRNETALNILDNFSNEVERRAQTAYKVRGLEAPQQQSASGAPSVGKVRVRDPKGIVRLVDQDKVSLALANGGVLVE